MSKSLMQGDLRAAFDRSDAQRLILNLSSLATSDSFLEITPGALFLWHVLLKREQYYFDCFLFSIMRFHTLKSISCC